ncbi:hypothetical protein DNTS_001696 [Danionella cerebrum]|uniref:Uncharacterized protein n=1 Tax=Danionella cerebrum TaxID=2873325 RepID=A0A553QJ73_9TELE|nr:hypothetical protein DNTS_001696 [Danionella translucida]
MKGGGRRQRGVMDGLRIFEPKWKLSAMKPVIVHLFLLLSLCQTAPSPSLQVRVSVPPPWQSLPLSQADLGLLFTNSSPFTSTQSLLLLPPSGTASKPQLHATFGSYTVAQVMSEAIPPLTPPVTASLLTKSVLWEMKGDRGERFRVRILFHMRGDVSRGACVTLHAFKQTEEQKASCIPQPPFGLCLVTLTLPSDWFEPKENTKANLDQISKSRLWSRHRSRSRIRGRRHPPVPGGHRPQSDSIQLYYSFFYKNLEVKTGTQNCMEDILQPTERKLYYIAPVGLEDQENTVTKQSPGCLDNQEEETFWLDSNVLVVYSKGPVGAGQPVRVLNRNFGTAMTITASWWVEYSTRTFSVSPNGVATSYFSFTDREVVGIATISETNYIINTAILTSEPVSLPVVVLAVALDGKASDVTTAVKCHSANEDIAKVSHDCSVAFVDGSESGSGSICVELEFSLGMLTGSLCVTVWTPVVPLHVSLSDSILSPISGWNFYSENGCEPVYQRSTVQVLAQFSAQSAAQGTPSYMLGSSDWFVDVTDLIHDWLRIEDPSIAALNKQNHLIGLKPGITSVYVISSQWDGVLGRTNVIVTSEPVTPDGLSVQLVGGLGLSINSSPSHASIVTATVNAHNTLYNLGQEASISVWIQFDDDSSTVVSAFNGTPYTLRLYSLAESVIVVTPVPSQQILAQGDGGGPLVKAELLVSTCEPGSNHVEMEVIYKGREVKRLAKGSGWIRVNLNMDFWPIDGEETNFEMHDVIDMLVENNKDLYDNFEDAQNTENTTYVYDSSNDIFRRKDLEQAVLIPNHKERAVYISPGVEKERKDVKTADRQVEIGIGVVLALLCLSSVLFLVNCLPCTLKEYKNRERQVANVKDNVEEDVDSEEQEETGNEGTRHIDVVIAKEDCMTKK